MKCDVVIGGSLRLGALLPSGSETNVLGFERGTAASIPEQQTVTGTSGHEANSRPMER